MYVYSKANGFIYFPRYSENNRIIKSGMALLGFSQFVEEKYDGHIITSFKYPQNHPSFNFQKFYDCLSAKGNNYYHSIYYFKTGN